MDGGQIEAGGNGSDGSGGRGDRTEADMMEGFAGLGCVWCSVLGMRWRFKAAKQFWSDSDAPRPH